VLEECRKEIYPELKRIVKERFNVELEEPLREYYGMGNTTIVHRPYSDNLLITGEAMGMVQPIYNYGFEPSLVYGKLAGKSATEAIKNDRHDRKALNGYGRGISNNEVCGYAWGNIAREGITAGSAIIGERFMGMSISVLRDVAERDLDVAYDLIAQRKLSLEAGATLIYPTFKELTKTLIEAFKTSSVQDLISDCLKYISDRLG